MPTFAGQFANEEQLTRTIFSETKDYFLNEWWDLSWVTLNSITRHKAENLK